MSGDGFEGWLIAHGRGPEELPGVSWTERRPEVEEPAEPEELPEAERDDVEQESS